MARVDSLGHFLTDVADAIRTKGGTSATIQASSFDTAIANLPSGGANEILSRTNTNFEVDWQELIIPNTITYLNNLFESTKKFTVLPKFSFNNNVISISSLYYGCSALTTVDASGWDISNVTNMNDVFSGCTALTTITFPTVFPTQTTSLQSSFYNCSSLTNLDLSSFNITVNNLYYTFRGCTNLTSLDISNIKLVSNSRINIAGLFYDCRQLTHIDMRSLDIAGSNIVGSSVMFTNVPTTCEIIVKDSANKTWMNNNYSNMTNVKTVAEYEAE